MDVVPSIILAKDALDETIGFIRKLGALNRSNAERSLREEIEFSIRLKLKERAIECLRTACAARDLTMVVIDPRTQFRHAVPAAYFDQRPAAELEFEHGEFGAYELPEIVVTDPLFQLVRPYRGWVHGFIDPEFRAWLENPTAGPQGGPRMRPYFHSASGGAVAKKREKWLSLRKAAQVAKRYLGISLGAAGSIVRDAGDSGEVQSRCDSAFGHVTLPAHAWGEIDLENEILIGSDGVKKRSGVEINDEDLRFWLKQNRLWLPSTAEADSSSTPTSELPGTATTAAADAQRDETREPLKAAPARQARKGGRNPGDGTKDDEVELEEMLHLIAEKGATSPNAAAKKIIETSKAHGDTPAQYAYRRLSSKFIERYGQKRQDRESWGDTCRRIADEMKAK
jgi:hypothetical protein